MGPTEHSLSWGKLFHFEQKVKKWNWLEDARFNPTENSSAVLPYGLGRSYGDSCLNENGLLIDTSGLNRFIDFDTKTGILKCEAGVSFANIIQTFLPHGWFLPVTPGTQFITVAGAIANDIHGKNHHRAGTFGRYVKSLCLLRSDGSLHLCSPTENAALFSATIGGLGLTGVILWAEIELKPVKSPIMGVEQIRMKSLDDYFELSRESDQLFEYTVAWIDCLARGKNLGRGIYMRANHSLEQGKAPKTKKRHLPIPFEFPHWALNRLSVKAFNFLYLHKQWSSKKYSAVSYEPFFYPLDAVENWNRCYGKRGFYQYQFVIPPEKKEIIREVLDRIAESGLASFLSVMKDFGSLDSPGMLSFPKAGLTLALDFPNEGDRLKKLFQSLDRLVLDAGGRFYPAKDAQMSKEIFQATYPNWKEFEKFKDPHFSSSFWRRVTGE